MKRLCCLWVIFVFVFSFGQKKDIALKEARELIYTKPEKAIQKSEVILRETPDDETKIAALIVIINAEMFLERSRDVIDHCGQAIELAKKGKYTYQEITLLSMLGSHYQTMMMNENAKKYLDKAENMMDSIKMPDSLFYVKGNLYNVKGMVFRDELNCEFALKYFDKALDVYKRQNNNKFSVTNIALINIQKGSCLLSEGEQDKAKQCFRQVLDSDFNLGFNRYYAEICLAEILLKEKNYKDASRLLDEIPVKEIEKVDPELSSLYFLAMSRLSNSTGDMRAFQIYIGKYANAIKNLNIKRSKVINQLIYDSNIKNTKYINNIQRDNVLITFFIAILAIILILFAYKKSKEVFSNNTN